MTPSLQIKMSPDLNLVNRVCGSVNQHVISEAPVSSSFYSG